MGQGVAFMTTDTYNASSLRSRQARLSTKITPIVRFCLLVFGFCLVLFGIGLVIYMDNPVGWFVTGLSTAPIMVYVFWKIHLRELPTHLKTASIDGRLEVQLLANLPKGKVCSPKDILHATTKTIGGQFFANRFGLLPSFIEGFLDTTPEKTSEVWRVAREIADSQGQKIITGVCVFAAIIRTEPSIASVLPHLQLELADITAGLSWYANLARLFDNAKVPVKTGGIARDLSFGYTPTLTRFGQNISERMGARRGMTTEVGQHQELIKRMVDILSGGGRQNIALVGQSGSGKTTLISSFARELLNATGTIPDSLRFRQIVTVNPATLISAAPGRGQLEGLLNRILYEAYLAKNIIICFDDAQLFFTDGTGSVDVSSLLLPILEAGRLRIILAMDEQQYLKISQRLPSLAAAVNKMPVAPLDQQDTMQVLEEQALLIELKHNVTITYQALKETYRLSERYVQDLVMPGRALSLLESSTQFNSGELVTKESVVAAIENIYGIRIGVAENPNERSVLLNLEDKIHERMINQTQAVKTVSDALRRARSGVRNENKPIGTFLFLGPTGVGKTELAKALSEVYFGGESNLVRIDLNEYVSQSDVARLIADGASNPNSLTASVMKHPFAVVLLDEIEKAHDSVLSTLLQLLDEGMLRDINGKQVSFRDAIIIATSNAGADLIRSHIEKGEDLQKFESSIIDELLSTNQFRPEFLNRFDEIVMFRPLNKQELLQVVDLIIADLNKNLSQQKLSVIVSDEAKQVLVERGYDPRLGARPMRRIVQKTVENYVARQVLSGSLQPGAILQIGLNEVEDI